MLATSFALLTTPAPRAVGVTIAVSACLAFAVPRRVALAVCLALLVAASFGLSVDAAPPSPSASSLAGNR